MREVNLVPTASPPGGAVAHARPTKADIVPAFRRETITTAAIRVIARSGVASMRVQDVAAEASVSKGTVYLYFRGREELRAAAEQRDEVILAALAFSHDPQSRLDGLLSASDPVMAPQVLDCLRGMLERRLRENPPRDVDEVAASTVSMLLHGIAAAS